MERTIPVSQIKTEAVKEALASANGDDSSASDEYTPEEIQRLVQFFDILVRVDQRVKAKGKQCELMKLKSSQSNHARAT